MKKNGGMNALLIELVIVLFFFILSFSVLAQVYAHSYLTERDAAIRSEALFEAQNVCALLRAADAPEETLARAGFVPGDGQWEKECEGYSLVVKTEKNNLPAGEWWQMDVSAKQETDIWFTLPASGYIEGVGP